MSRTEMFGLYKEVWIFQKPRKPDVYIQFLRFLFFWGSLILFYQLCKAATPFLLNDQFFTNHICPRIQIKKIHTLCELL